MFGDLLKSLLQKQVKSSLQDKLGGPGASILGGMFGGDFGDMFGGSKNPLQDLFGDKWQNGGGDMFHRFGDTGESENKFQDILKYFK